MLHTITLSFFSVILLSSFALLFFFFFFNDTATTEIYTLSLHDALPISDSSRIGSPRGPFERRWLRSPAVRNDPAGHMRSEEHTSELQSLAYLVCRLLLEKKKKKNMIETLTAIICLDLCR